MGEEKRIKGRMVSDDERRYEGEILNGLPDGQGTIFTQSGRYTGEFVKGIYNGYGEMYMYPRSGKEKLLFDNGEYVEGALYKGTWKNGKMNGRFEIYYMGLPYDREFNEGKEVPTKLYYDIEMPKDDVAPGSIRCVYGGQSSFVVETENATFVFDWYRASLPVIRKDKPVYVFISHAHLDHFNHDILNMADDFEDIHFYMGLDIDGKEKKYYEDNFESLFEKVDDFIEYFVGNEVLETEFGEITTLTSTDLGVAFLVKTEGVTLFHAGDLSWFSPVGSIKNFKKMVEEQNPGMDLSSKSEREIKILYENVHDQNGNAVARLKAEFVKNLSLLSDVEIDYAMLPLDPRFGSYGIYTLEAYLETAKIKSFTPMHMWDQYAFASEFAKIHPQMAERMVSVNPGEEKMKQTIELKKPYTVKFSDFTDNRRFRKMIMDNDPCPCGSGRRFKDCHKKLIKPKQS